MIDDFNFISPGIFAAVFEQGVGDGSNITITTEKLTLNEGAQILVNTFGSGNAGDLIINASESIELTGTIPDSNNPSGLFANVGIPLFSIPTSGNGGDITINTPRLVVRDGAQIGTTAQNDGNSGTLTINASESVLLSGFSPLAEFRGQGISGIFVSVEPSFEDESGTITTTGNGGTLNLTSKELILDQGASISADTFSLGEGGNTTIDADKLIVRNGSEIRAGSLLGRDSIDTQRGVGGTLNINASDSIEVTGTGDINGTLVNSSLLTLAESNGNAGNLTLTTDQLTISNGGEINASSFGLGNGGLLNIQTNSLSLDNGAILANVGTGAFFNTDQIQIGGNTRLLIEDSLILRNNSLISASAFGTADGGTVTIDSGSIIAFPSQPPRDGNDIIATAEQGFGGNIAITVGVLVPGIEIRPATPANGTNDIDASSGIGIDGSVIIPNFFDFNFPEANLIESKQTITQACTANRVVTAQGGLTIKGKGGVPPAPELPLNSQNISINGEFNPTSTIPQPIETSQGQIQPARGIKVTESGGIILTAYRTNNAGERIPESSRNCDQA